MSPQFAPPQEHLTCATKRDKEMAAGIVKLFATVLALVGPAPADSPKEFQLKAGEKIVAIGDSITAEAERADISATSTPCWPSSIPT